MREDLLLKFRDAVFNLGEEYDVSIMEPLYGYEGNSIIELFNLAETVDLLFSKESSKGEDV